MSLTNNGSDIVMPVSPMYGGGSGNCGLFGDGNAAWIVLLLLLAGNGGWGLNGGFGGGYGNMMLGYDFPWLLNGQNGINNNVSDGFRSAQLSNSLNGIQSGVQGISNQICNCCGDMQMSIANGFANAETAAASRQMANMQTAFTGQSTMAQGFNQVGAGLADLKYTIATENCADRAAVSDGARDIIANQNAGIQRILDQLCQDKIDAKNDEIAQLRQENLYARGQASQLAQNQQIVNDIYNRLDTCPVGTTPVYGRTPIFTCNNGCGCNGNSFFN